MANFPNSLDSFTNPTSTDTLNNPSHFLQHADANDAIEALEAKVGIGTATASSATAGQVFMANGGGTSIWATLGTVTNAVITGGTATSTVLTAPEETITITATASSGTVALNCASGGVTFATANASANWVTNLQAGTATTLNSILNVGQSITHVYLNTNGATPYYHTSLQIDGTAVTPRWQSASTPTAGNANSIDAYSFTVIKTSTTPTYSVLASQVRFG